MLFLDVSCSIIITFIGNWVLMLTKIWQTSFRTYSVSFSIGFYKKYMFLMRFTIIVYKPNDVYLTSIFLLLTGPIFLALFLLILGNTVWVRGRSVLVFFSFCTFFEKKRDEQFLFTVIIPSRLRMTFLFANFSS